MSLKLFNQNKSKFDNFFDINKDNSVYFIDLSIGCTDN